MVDINKALQIVMKTGTVVLGAQSSIKAVKHGNGKLIIMAANAPSTIKSDISYYAQLSDIPLVEFEGSTLDLGFVCGKPFLISTMVIQEPGDSDILNLVEVES